MPETPHLSRHARTRPHRRIRPRPVRSHRQTDGRPLRPPLANPCNDEGLWHRRARLVHRTDLPRAPRTRYPPQTAMTTLPIVGDITPLATGVKRGQLKRMSSDFSHYGCLAVTIWLTSGEGFRLTSSMQTLTDGIEGGVLKLEILLHRPPAE